MAVRQENGIRNTIIVTLLVMTVFLLLFLNKILTPRYLSDIELKINGFVWLDEPYFLPAKMEKKQWRLLASTSEQMQQLESAYTQMKRGVRNKTNIVFVNEGQRGEWLSGLPESDVVAVISPEDKVLAYIKPPFDEQKFLLTYSSVVTHR